MTYKPPLGIKPKFVWEAERRDSLSNAIRRRLDEVLFLPIEWVDEYNELARKREEYEEE